MLIYLRFSNWALHWQLGGFDAVQARMVIAVVRIDRGFTPWRGYSLYWSEKPNWKEFPTVAAIGLERTAKGRTVLYTFRGPIERRVLTSA